MKMDGGDMLQGFAFNFAVSPPHFRLGLHHSVNWLHETKLPGSVN